MENQTPSFEEIQARIAGGDQEAAAMYVSNPEAFTPNVPSEPLEATETIQTPDESDYVEIEPETPSEDVTEPVTEEVEEKTEEFVNPLDEQREIYDRLEADRIEKEKAYKEQLEKAEEEKQALLKQVEEARIAAEQVKAREEVEEEFSFFDDADSGKPVVETTAPATEDAKVADDELRKEFEALKQSVTEQRIMDEAVSEYTRFWNSPEGQKLKPNGLDAKPPFKNSMRSSTHL